MLKIMGYKIFSTKIIRIHSKIDFFKSIGLCEINASMQQYIYFLYKIVAYLICVITTKI